MKEKLLIPVALFVVCQTAYDNFAPLQSTNWTIFYFASMYFSWFLMLYLLPKGIKLSQKIPYFILEGGILLYLFKILLKYNMGYQEFMVSVNNYEANLLIVCVIISCLTIYIFKKWPL